MNKFCTTCGNEVYETFRICPNCGDQSFNIDPASESHFQHSPETTKVVNYPNIPLLTLESKTSPEKVKSNWWDWILPTIIVVLIVKFFGIIGGLVTYGCFYWLKPKLGMWGAVAVSGVIGFVVAVVFLALVQN
jgi:hypothetical protein